MAPEHPPRRPRRRHAGAPAADRRTEHTDPTFDEPGAATHNARSAATPIVIEPPGYVELSEADRREAVVALADLLANWWEREQRATGQSPPRRRT